MSVLILFLDSNEFKWTELLDYCVLILDGEDFSATDHVIRMMIPTLPKPKKKKNVLTLLSEHRFRRVKHLL